MAEPAWQEILRARLVERNAKESAYASIIEQYRRLAQQTKLLKERNATLLRAMGTARANPSSSTVFVPGSGEDNPVRAAYITSLESQISSLRDELATVYKTQGQNAQRLLAMNETLREKEELSRVDSENLRKTRDELATLRRKVDQHNELMAEKDRTAQILHDEINTLQLELSQIEERNQTLTKDNAKLLQRWLDAKQAEVNKMNEANDFYEDMQTRRAAVLTWRSDSGASEENKVDTSSAPPQPVSGNGEEKKEADAVTTKDGMPSQGERTSIVPGTPQQCYNSTLSTLTFATTTMRTQFVACAILTTTVLSPFASAVPLQGLSHADDALSPYHMIGARMFPVDTGVAARAVTHHSDPDNDLYNPTGQRATAGSGVVSALHNAPRDVDPKALDQYTAGGNAYSGATENTSGGSVISPLDSHVKSSPHKRTTDDTTMGGNAYTGSTGAVDGGDISDVGNDGMPTVMNWNSNNGGNGGTSRSGCAGGGYGDDKGSGGNGYSGSTGSARGGEVNGVGGMFNMDSNNAGSAGVSQSGCATGGDGDIRPSEHQSYEY
ncbi:autophagy protein 16-domain-containing protein [Amylocystis lapponica]|nr:autophagy protein 16-domain-containing protein [Amylocystis lapponica]